MAPSKAAANATPLFAKDERVLCFHGEMLYEAKVMDSRFSSEGSWQFKIHYKGWKNTWDDWVALDRVMKFTEENKMLASQLENQMKALQQKGPSKTDKKKGSRANASDNSSLRGSEERHASVAAQPQRNRRTAREYELEPVGLTAANINNTCAQPTCYAEVGFTAANINNTCAQPTCYAEVGLTAANINNTSAQPTDLAHTQNNDADLTHRSSTLNTNIEIRLEDMRVKQKPVQLKPADNEPDWLYSQVEQLPPSLVVILPYKGKLFLPQSHIIKLRLDPKLLRQFSAGPSTTTRGRAASEDQIENPAKRRKHCGGTAATVKAKSVNTLAKEPSTTTRSRMTSNRQTENQAQSSENHGGTAANVTAKPVDTLARNPSTQQKGYTVKGVPSIVPPTKSREDSDEEPQPHPDLARHIERGTATQGLRDYYQDMSHLISNPLAGIFHEPLFTGLFRELVPDYDLQIQYHWTAIKNDPQFDEYFNEESVRANRKYQEENFHARPAVRIPIPDHLKAMLVDDWENVTKNQMLVPIPCPKPVNTILNDYLAAERPKRMVPNAQGKNGASSSADILMEVVSGLREYFEKCLGRILLYKFERNQYLSVLGQQTSGEGEFANKEIGDIYGAEHFCRLLVTLPELIAQTNMSKDAVTHLREEIAKITNWLGRNAVEYFASSYEHPGQDYIENARRS